MSLLNLVEPAPDHQPLDAFLVELARVSTRDLSAVLDLAKDAFEAAAIAVFSLDAGGRVTPLIVFPEGFTPGLPPD